MGKSFDFEPVSESGNWNVASDYVRLKIMKLLYELDELELLALYGNLDIATDVMINDDNFKNNVRYKSLLRMNTVLSMLIRNVFFCFDKTDSKKAKDFLDDIKQIRIVIPECKIERSDLKNKNIKIFLKEDVFQKLLDLMIEIKTDILAPMNKSDLIFTHTETFDAKEYKDKIRNKFIEGG